MEIPKTQIEEIPKTEEMPKTQVAAETKANLQLWPSLARSLLFNKHSLLYFWQNNPKTWKWHCKAASACSWVRRRKCSGGGNVENTKIKGQIQIQRQKVPWWWSRKNTPNFLWLSCNATPAVALVNMWNKIQNKNNKNTKVQIFSKVFAVVQCKCAALLLHDVQTCKIQITAVWRQYQIWMWPQVRWNFTWFSNWMNAFNIAI